MSLPKQYEVTEAEMWSLWNNDEIDHAKTITLDHIVLAKKLDGTPVWVRVAN